MKIIFKRLILLEKEKYTDNPIWSIVSFILLLFYFYSFPILALPIYSKFLGHETYSVYIVGNCVVHFIAYTIIHSGFTLASMSNSKIIQSCKVSPDPWPWESDPEFNSKLYSVFKSFIVNQFILIPLFSITLGFKAYFITDPNLFPSLSVNCLQVFFFIIFEDLANFCGHRLMHSPLLYKLFHKKHHEFIMSISISAEYAHPVEFGTTNMIPLAVGPLLYGHEKIHIITWFMWVFFRVFHTAELHCGLYVPWSPIKIIPFGTTALYHDDHHSKNVGNYGSFFTIWDTVIGSNGFVKKKKSN